MGRPFFHAGFSTISNDDEVYAVVPVSASFRAISLIGTVWCANETYSKGFEISVY